MSASSEAEAEGASAGEDGRDESPPRCKIVELTAILHKVLKKPWLPDVQYVQGEPFIKVSRHCPHLTRLCSGKSLNRHLYKKGEQVALRQMFFSQICSLRKQACDRRYREMIMENIVPGEELPKIRSAKDSDKYTCGRSVVVDVSSEDLPPHSFRLLWGVSGQAEFWMSLTEENLEYCVRAITASPDQPKEARPKAKAACKGSPRKRRRLRRRKSDSVEPLMQAAEE